MMLDIIQKQDEQINEKIKKLENVDEILKSNINQLDHNFNDLINI